MKIGILPLAALLLACVVPISFANETWGIDSQAEWQENTAAQSNLEFKEGIASPIGKTATFQSTIKRYKKKQAAKSIVFEQSPIWENWQPMKNIGPSNLGDAPVMLSIGRNNYWMFGRYGNPKRPKGAAASKKPFASKPATLEGFDIPLHTTQDPNQYNAPGGLKPGKGGYHAWQSRDMVNWVHHGAVTEGFSKWVTSAEHVDGKTYIYYDFPNDQDPHVYVDDDLTDGLPGKNVGMAFKDPSHGSDSGFIRDLDGKFHVIYEDWSPMMAQKRSWDSSLAGHAVSDTGVGDFTIMAPAVDERTTPTGEIKTYTHPHWVKEDPKNYKTNVAEYEVHTPNQEAFGDWAAISIGGQYYLFGDYDPEHGKPMSVAWFTSASIDKQFTFCSNIGKGHPDPDICFAEGRFYLATQQSTDYVSDGPWVESVEVRVGVDSDNDGQIDQWTEWQAVKETYDHTPGFAKQVKKKPASADVSALPAGFGFQFEVKITDTTENQSKPMLDKVTLSLSN